MFDYSDGLLKYVLPEKALDQGVSLKIKMTDTVSDLLVNLKLQLENSHPCITEYEFIEARPLSSKYVHLLRKIQDLDPSLLLKDSKFYHKMCLVIVPVIHESELLRSATSYIGEEFEPITINCNILGEKSLIAVNKGWTLENLSSKIMEVSGIPPSLQILKLLKPQGDTREFTDNDLPKTLIELKFYHSAQLSVNMKEDFDEIIEEKKPEVSQDMVTVLVNDENDVNNVIQHFVSID